MGDLIGSGNSFLELVRFHRIEFARLVGDGRCGTARRVVVHRHGRQRCEHRENVLFVFRLVMSLIADRLV